MLNAAHEHAANAEDMFAQGLTKRTLKMLYNDHQRAGKDLERRIEQLKAEGKDPSLPHKVANTPRASTMPERRTEKSSHSPQSESAPSAPLPRPMTDSQGVDESFMLLGGQRSDPGDPFNQFWNIMQGMLDNLSQPVAFATAPLGHVESVSSSSKRTKLASHLPREGSLSSDTDLEEPIVSRFARRLGISGDIKKQDRSSSNLKPLSSDLDGDEDSEAGDELAESFYLIPSSAEPTAIELKQENASLTLEIEVLKKRLENVEQAYQKKDAHLRDSIYMATKEAHRAMTLGTSVNGPQLLASILRETPGTKTGREAQYAKRVKELEDELRAARDDLRGVRAENDKQVMLFFCWTCIARLYMAQKAMITRYQEKWEKLKESAKRRKESKAAAGASRPGGSLAREQIPEEPEPGPDDP
ncbi:unnamed protein product [Mycena citricolor]|uniref:Uncharacterized protein n=1 Tax=Mycena citricolor TaxID=2018698 RepID=A0AAD2HMW6_9AGAR|nr:unnamed protein product [Mycena citricolor]